MSRRHHTSVSIFLALVLSMAGAWAPGCNQGSSSSGSGSTSSSSSGDEDDEGSSSGDRADRGDIESPPGSREPTEDDDSMPEGDLEHDDGSSGGSTGTTGTAGSTTGSSGSSGTGSSGAAAESPWGRPDADTGEALPARPQMTGSARDHYRRGLQLAGSGDAAGAQREFQAARDADSRAFRAIYNLAVLADRAGNDDQALQLYRQALTVQPDYERALAGILAIYVRQGRASEAVSFIQPIADRWVRNLHVQAVYADALVMANRAQEGIEAARRALRRDERFVPAMIAMVKANLRLGRTELAQSILEQALGIDQSNAEAHFLRGRMYQEESRLADAMREYRRAIELRGDYADARMALGLQLLAGANYDEAVQQFEAVARLVPEEPEVHLNLGDAYRSTKQWTKAKASYDRFTELRPRGNEVHFNLGLMYLAQSTDQTGEEQLATLQRAQQEFTTFRDARGPLPPRTEDQAATYLEELGRQIDRTKRAIERDAARRQREAERAARRAAEGGGEAGGSGGDSSGGTTEGGGGG